jgi:glycosyltransferase involved in cell wall biosynthesis
MLTSTKKEEMTMDASNQVSISATIITLNEEQKIEPCLQSLQGVVDEIVVVDSFSTDRTEEICRKYNAIFLKHPFDGYVAQKNVAVKQATHDIILALDADERLSDDLRASIIKVKNNWGRVDGYGFNRRNNYCGKWIGFSGWYPDRKVRLWDRRKAQWAGEDPHDKVVIQPDRLGRLKGDLLHMTFLTMDEHLLQMHKFADVAAKAKYGQRRKPVFLIHVLLSPAFKFFRKYVLQLGFLDGYYGFVVSATAASLTFYKYLKLYEYHRRGVCPSTPKFEGSVGVMQGIHMTNGVKISAVIITFNEERKIEECIKSLLPVADEIVIVDSCSTDRTKDICSRYPVKFITHAFEGYVAQKNFALRQCTHDHVLALDADERLSDELRQSVLKVKENWGAASGYAFNRFNNYCGKWIRFCGWYPDRKIRLWDRRTAVWGGEDPHDKVIMPVARVKQLKGDLLHYAYYSVDEHLLQVYNFAAIAARAKFRNGIRPVFVVHVLLNPAFKFLKNFVFRLGFLDGYYGFVFCALTSGLNFYKYLRLYEYHRKSLPGAR